MEPSSTSGASAMEEDTFTHVGLVGRSESRDSRSSSTTTPTRSAEEKADWLRAKLRERIKQSKTYRRPLNILVVGRAGVGKSSFINSAIQAFLKMQGSWLMTGSSIGQGRANITALMRWINIFDPLEDDTSRMTKEEIAALGEEDIEESLEDTDPEEKILRRMSPRFVDVCGLPDENNHGIREVLRLLTYGHIPKTANVLSAYAFCSKEGPAALRAKYPTGNKNLAVDRVIFLCAADEDIPTQLMNAVMAVVQPTIPDESTELDGQKVVPVFGAITKSDRILSMDDNELAKYEARRARIMNTLALTGDETRFAEIQNYVSRYGEIADVEDRYNDPIIDAKILRFMYDLSDRSIYVALPDSTLPFAPAPSPSPDTNPVPPGTVLHSPVVEEVGPRVADTIQTSRATSMGMYAVSGVILALAVYLGVLLHYNVLGSMITAHPAGAIPAAGLTLAPILFLLYVLFFPNNNFQR